MIFGTGSLCNSDTGKSSALYHVCLVSGETITSYYNLIVILDCPNARNNYLKVTTWSYVHFFKFHVVYVQSFVLIVYIFFEAIKLQARCQIIMNVKHYLYALHVQNTILRYCFNTKNTIYNGCTVYTILSH